MPTVQLPDRTIVSVKGEDAQHFLQNILTTDIDALPRGEARPGALLAPQGKIMFDFLISRHDANGFLLDVDGSVTDDFIKRLTLYRLRAKAEIIKQDQMLVGAVWETDSAASDDDSIRLADRRFPDEAKVQRVYAPVIAADADAADWDAIRIAHGVSEGGKDFAFGDAFPHDVLLDLNGGVGFSKGCYVGQEVVSRMQHRGTARRRVMIARAEEDLPAGGSEIRTGGRPIGTLGTVHGSQGLAIVRIDRVKDAIDAGQAIEAGEVLLDLSIPGWAAYDFPAKG